MYSQVWQVLTAPDTYSQVWQVLIGIYRGDLLAIPYQISHNEIYYQSERRTEPLMEWEQIHAQQEKGKWHGLLEVLQKTLPSKNHNAWGPVTATNKWTQPSCESN